MALVTRRDLLKHLLKMLVGMDKRDRVQTQINDMENFEKKITEQYEQKPNCEALKVFEEALTKGRQLLQRLGWSRLVLSRLICKPTTREDIGEWIHKSNNIVRQLVTRLQGLEADSGLVGFGIKYSLLKIERWLTKAPHVILIGVYGMVGIGKTALLKSVCNAYRFTSVFDDVILIEEGNQTPDLQEAIAAKVNRDWDRLTADEKKTKLSEHLEKSKVLLVLDGVRSPLNLREICVAFGKDKGSKVVFSMNIDPVDKTKAEEFMKRASVSTEGEQAWELLEIKPLSTEESWELFCKIAFQSDHAPPKIEYIARKVVGGCEGLPSAIQETAKSMVGKTDELFYDLALRCLLKGKLEGEVREEEPEEEQYGLLNRIYDELLDPNIKKCFLYCGMFVWDETIDVDKLVGMWAAEGLVSEVEANQNIQKLVDLFLLELHNGSTKAVGLKAFHAVRDMAISIGNQNKECLFQVGQMTANFPDLKNQDLKRISFSGSNIKKLPTDLRCPNLLSLILSRNLELKVPEGFFQNLIHLKVLDLSYTQIDSLPASLWQLRQLKFLNLSATQIEDVSEDVGNLSELQFLDLSLCIKLKSMPWHKIVELKDLKCLNLDRCVKLKSLSCDLGRLQSLKYVTSNCEFVPLYDSEEYLGSAIL